MCELLSASLCFQWLTCDLFTCLCLEEKTRPQGGVEKQIQLLSNKMLKKSLLSHICSTLASVTTFLPIWRKIALVKVGMSTTIHYISVMCKCLGTTSLFSLCFQKSPPPPKKNYCTKQLTEKHAAPCSLDIQNFCLMFLQLEGNTYCILPEMECQRELLLTWP